MKRDDLSLIVFAAVLVGLVGFSQGWLPSLRNSLTPATKDALIVIVHDGDGVADYAEKAVNDLRAAGRQVRLISVYADNGLGQAPKEVAPAIESAKASGLPALVLLSGGKPIKTGKLPATTEAILEACK